MSLFGGIIAILLLLINLNLTQLNQRMDSQDARFDRVDTRTERRIDSLEGSILVLANKQDNLDRRLTGWYLSLSNLITQKNNE